jgi:hypothetical protein
MGNSSMDEKNSSTEQDSGNEKSPVSEATASEPNHPAEEPEDTCYSKIAKRWQHTWKEWKTVSIDRKIELFVGFAILVAAIVSARVASFQWSAMVESNSISREAFTSVQRAFITVSSFDTPVRLSDAPGQPNKQVKYWWFIPNIKNSGNTPTKNMKYFIGANCPRELNIAVVKHMAVACDFTRQDIIDPVDLFNNPTFKDKEDAAILGPQSAIALGGIGITEASIQAIAKGFNLFIFGVISYNDIFPHTKKHITKFCYQAGANLSEKSEIVSTFGFCAHWNCADDECDDDRKAWDADVAAGKIQKPFEPPKP